MGKRSRFPGKSLLGFAERLPGDRGQIGDFVFDEERELAEVGAHHGILGVHPVLVVVVGREEGWIEPDAQAGACLAHLLARGRGDERRDEREGLAGIGAANQLDAAGDVGPLVGPAHLQHTVFGAEEMEEVVGLDETVIELDEVEALTAVQPGAVGLQGQHLVDREVTADIAEERDVLKLEEPVGVVQHQRRRIVAETTALVVEVFRQLGLNADQVVLKIFQRDHLARRGLAGWIADHGGATAAEGDWPVTHSLQGGEQHDGDHVPGMQ